MNNSSHHRPYKRHRYPAEIIQHAVWLYFRFCLSYRDVEDLLAERGIVVSRELRSNSVLVSEVGHVYARHLWRRRTRPGDKWYLDELFSRIGGKTHYPYCAVDQDGANVDILVQQLRL